MSPRAFGHGPFDIGRLPPAIKGLVISNIAVFALSQMVRGQFIGIFGLIPAKVTGELWIWQLFTYLFIHAGFMHLLFNLFALGMFGMPIESQWGSREFLRYYLVCGIGGGLFQVLVSPGSAFPILGASGAVFGLLVAFAMLYPDAVVYLYFFFPIKAKHMAILFGVIELLAGTAETTPVVARFTHLGGMLIGYVYLRWGWVLRSRVQQAISGLPPAPESRAKAKRARPAKRVELDAEAEIEEVNRIIEKVGKEGRGALTATELETLERYGKRHGPPQGSA